MPYVMNHPDIPGGSIEVMSEDGVKHWETVGWELDSEATKTRNGGVVYPSEGVFPSDQAPTPASPPSEAQTGSTAKGQE